MAGSDWIVHRGAIQDERREEGGQAGGGGTLISPGMITAAAERSQGSPLPLPGRMGRWQHLLKLWSLAQPRPGAIWRALLRKPQTPTTGTQGSRTWAEFGDFFPLGTS